MEDMDDREDMKDTEDLHCRFLGQSEYETEQRQSRDEVSRETQESKGKGGQKEEVGLEKMKPFQMMETDHKHLYTMVKGIILNSKTRLWK